MKRPNIEFVENERLFYGTDHIEYIYDDTGSEGVCRELVSPTEAAGIKSEWDGLTETVFGFNGMKCVWRIY